jgi:hypothetical protein
MNDEVTQMDQEDSKVLKKPPVLRIILVALGVLIVLGALLVWWSYLPHGATKSFKEPKIVTAHIDEEPFARLQLKPGESYRAIEVMAGTTVPFFCNVVSTQLGSHFKLKAFGQELLESDDCVYELEVPQQIGTFHTFVLSYWNDDFDGEPTDVMEIPIVIVAKNERVEFQAVEDAQGNRIVGASVPDEVKIFTRIMTSLPKDGRNYAALFFTADPSNNVPVLQLAPVIEGEKATPLVGSVIRYRSYGKDLAGYAAWTPEPLTLIGEGGEREVVDIYVGIFERENVPELFTKLIEIKMKDADTISVTPLIKNPEELKALTVHGRLLSPPLHLVRGGGSAKSADSLLKMGQ